MKLIIQFPKSPHFAEALYHAGVLFSEGAKPNPEKSVVAFERLTKEFPKSPWTGDAHVRLIDVCLEQQFDLPAAEKHAQAAVKWLETVDKAALEKAARPLGASSSLPTAHRPPTTTYSIYLRAGLIEYLNERCPKAVEWFEKAKPFAPKRDFVVVYGHIPTGIEKLIDLAKSDKFLTPHIVREGDAKAKLILMLSDALLQGRQHVKVTDLCNVVIQGERIHPTKYQKSWAHYQKASAACGMHNHTDAHDDYLVAERTCPKAPWAPGSLLQAGCISNNMTGDKARAIAECAAVVRRYPESEVADRAAYFIGVTYEWDKQWDRAKTAYEWFIAKYPESRWAEAVRTHRLPNVEAHLKANRRSHSWRPDQ